MPAYGNDNNPLVVPLGMISDFGRTDDGRDVKMITLRSDELECTVLDLGCSLRSLA